MRSSRWSPRYVEAEVVGEMPSSPSNSPLIATCPSRTLFRWFQGLGLLLVAVIFIVIILCLTVTSSVESTSAVSKTATLTSEMTSVLPESKRKINATNNGVNKTSNMTMKSPSAAIGTPNIKSLISVQSENVHGNRNWSSRIISETRDVRFNSNVSSQEPPTTKSLPLKYVRPSREETDGLFTGDLDTHTMIMNKKNYSSLNPRERSQNRSNQPQIRRHSFQKPNRIHRMTGNQTGNVTSSISDMTMARAQSTIGEFNDINDRDESVRGYFRNESDSSVIVGDRLYDLSSQMQSSRQKNENNHVIYLNPEQKIRGAISRADSMNNVTNIRRKNVKENDDSMKSSTTVNSKMEPASTAAHTFKLVVLLLDPKEMNNHTLDVLFNNSKEIVGPFSAELFDSRDVLRDVSVKVVNYSNSKEVDFKIINLRNLSNEESSPTQRNSTQNLPNKKEDIHFISFTKTQNTRPNPELAFQNELLFYDDEDQIHKTPESENNEFGVMIGSIRNTNLDQNEESSVPGLEEDKEKEFMSIRQANKKVSRVKIRKRKLGQFPTDFSRYRPSNSYRISVPTNASSVIVSASNLNTNSKNEFNSLPLLSSEKGSIHSRTIINETEGLENISKFSPVASQVSGSIKTRTHQQSNATTASQPLMQDENNHRNVFQSLQPQFSDAFAISRSSESPRFTVSETVVNHMPLMRGLTDPHVLRPSSSLPTSSPGTRVPVWLLGEDLEGEQPAADASPSATSSSHYNTKTTGQPGATTQRNIKATVSSVARYWSHYNQVWRNNDGGNSREAEPRGSTGIHGAKYLNGSQKDGSYTDENENANHFPTFQTGYRGNLLKMYCNDTNLNSETINTIGDINKQHQTKLQIDDNRSSYYYLTTLIPKGHLQITLINQHKELERSKSIDLSSKSSPPKNTHKGTTGVPSVSHQKKFQSSSSSYSSPEQSRETFHRHGMNSPRQGQQKAGTISWSVHEAKLHEGREVSFVLPMSDRKFYVPLGSHDEQNDRVETYKPEYPLTFSRHPKQLQVLPALAGSSGDHHRTDLRPVAELNLVTEFPVVLNDVPPKVFNQQIFRTDLLFHSEGKEEDLISPEAKSHINTYRFDHSMKNIEYYGRMDNAKTRNNDPSILDADFADRNDEFIILNENLENNSNKRIQWKSHSRPRSSTETTEHSIISALAANIDYADSYHKFVNRSWPTYDFSFHFHRDLANKSEFRRKHLLERN